MKRYAVFVREGDDTNFEWPQMCGDEMEQTCIRLSDWYCHADDVAAILEANDREIAQLRGNIQGKDAILHHSAVAATAARNRINDLEAQLAAVHALLNQDAIRGDSGASGPEDDPMCTCR